MNIEKLIKNLQDFPLDIEVFITTADSRNLYNFHCLEFSPKKKRLVIRVYETDLKYKSSFTELRKIN